MRGLGTSGEKKLAGRQQPKVGGRERKKSFKHPPEPSDPLICVPTALPSPGSTLVPEEVAAGKQAALFLNTRNSPSDQHCELCFFQLKLILASLAKVKE